MKYPFLAVALLGLCGWQQASAQTPKAQAIEQEILKEGLALYESERASWVATDLLLARKPDMSQLGGYFSYADGDSVRTVFVKRSTAPNLLTVAYSFSFHRSAIEPAAARQQGTRAGSAREQKLYALRETVEQELVSGEVARAPYQFPENTRPNIILLDQGPTPRAYVLVGPQEAGVLPIGNDFLLRFTAAGKLQKVERLHNSYLAMRLPEGSQTVRAGMHSHLPAHPYITPTDICSLLLYKDSFPAPQHIVMGKDYVSVFDIEKQQLSFLNHKEFDKVYRNNK
ncbi:hypothetical protein [Hymenobacter sp. HSC-4F20]|uniref:hypothetical protein n=1 Tax=Hymenobacter sp. HSC-4F20 TaxID=2864135 RepID=UPI001C72B56C|nr:hypothetical protein [Hymenobacter sp. HSC-4F20]